MIHVEGLTKDFGPTRALDHVSFDVGDKQILGFLGPNGAGKSTAMKIITTYIAPGSGKVEVDGIDVTADPIAVRRKIGYLPETNPLYADMRVEEYLRFCGQARGLRDAELHRRLRFVTEACGIGNVLKKNINELSKGFRQRTGVAQALIHDPEILILDEPTSGLDPMQIIEIRKLIQQLSQEKTIIFSTHILQEVSSTTDRVIIINDGRIIADGYISDLKGQAAGAAHLRMAVVAARDEVEREFDAMEGLEKMHVIDERDGVLTVDLHVPLGKDLRREVGEVIARKQWPVLEFSIPSLSLEQAFIELIRKSRPHSKETSHV